MRRSGLGKGLSALIPGELAGEYGDGAAGPIFREIPVGDIEPNRYQPRRVFDEDSLTALTASIRELGVLQPVLVRPLEDDDRFELIAGERRWRAAKRAGMPTVPALVRPIGDTESLEQAVVENLHRQDLNPLEEAAAYQQLIEEFGLTHEQVADRVGKSRAAITNALRLFQLPPSIQKMVMELTISAGHAKALLGTPDRAFQEHLARRAAAEGLNVRQLEDAVRARSDGPGPPKKAHGSRSGDADGGSAPSERPAGLLELEELLGSYLDTRVSVTLGAGRGRVIVEFADLEDLERIYRRIAASE